MAQARKRQRRARVEPWVGAWLRSIRVASGKSLADIAERLQSDGGGEVIVSGVSRIELGETLFPSDELPRFLAAYETTLAKYAARSREVQRDAQRTAKRAA